MEPLSCLSVTAASVGLLSFLLASMISTARTIYHSKKEWKDYGLKLEGINAHVQDCKDKMEIINRTWALRGDWKDDEYKYLLGEDGFSRLQSLQELVNACEAVTYNSLHRYCGDTNNPKPGHVLKTFAQWLLTRSSAATESEEKSRVAMKAIFALVTGDELKSQVSTLSQYIDRLEDFLERRFDEIPEIAPGVHGKGEKAKFLEATLALRQCNTLFAEQMNNLIAAANKSGITCMLVPRLMDYEGHISRFMDRGSLTVTVSLQLSDCLDVSYSTLPQMTIFLGVQGPVPDLLLKLQHDQARANHSMVETKEARPFQTSLRQLHEVRSSERKIARYRHEVFLERINLALSLLTWVSITWKTEWTRSVCVCSLQRSTTPAGDAIFAIIPQYDRECSLCRDVNDKKGIGSHVSDNSQHLRAISQEVAQNRKLMTRLGLTLCEIALCTPIQIVGSDTLEPEFKYEGCAHSKDDLLGEVAFVVCGDYAIIAQELLASNNDSSIAVAPFDVVCHKMEGWRQRLQTWHDEFYQKYRQKHAKESWRMRPRRELEERILHVQDNHRLSRNLRTRKGQSVQELRPAAALGASSSTTQSAPARKMPLAAEASMSIAG